MQSCFIRCRFRRWRRYLCTALLAKGLDISVPKFQMSSGRCGPIFCYHEHRHMKLVMCLCQEQLNNITSCS